ncbi:MAG: hypothetical protein LBQ69_05075 [Treponema sp.]|nr:hypothetical protein [Treponema sp.]
MQNSFFAVPQGSQVVSGRPPVVKRGDDDHRAVHLSGYRCFKWYYQRHVRVQMRDYFSAPVSYNRFAELMGCAVLPPAAVYPGIQAGNGEGHQFYRLHALERMP